MVYGVIIHRIFIQTYFNISLLITLAFKVERFVNETIHLFEIKCSNYRFCEIEYILKNTFQLLIWWEKKKKKKEKCIIGSLLRKNILVY